MDAAVVAPAPAPAPPREIPAVTPWATGLYDCWDDPGVCCMTVVCPCMTFGLVAEIVDRGSTSSGASMALFAMMTLATGGMAQWVYSCFYRTKMRAQYGLQEYPCPDFLIHLFCQSCAICQEYRQLRSTGFNLDIGWHANMDPYMDALRLPCHPTCTQMGCAGETVIVRLAKSL